MARGKRAERLAQERAVKRRKQNDALLEHGVFQQDIADEVGDEMSSAPLKNGNWEDEEQDYELRPRKLQNPDDEMVEGLPIKINGRVERNIQKVTKQQLHEEDEDEDEGENESNNSEPQAGKVGEGSDAESDAEDYKMDTAEKIIQLKELIAELVGNIMENPEEHTVALTRLRKMTQSKNPNTSKFSILALVPVWRSIIPGYKIRPLTELERKEKVSKEVARLRNFEEKLLYNYKIYVEHIEKLSRVAMNESPLKVGLGNVAATAAVELAASFSHFNFRTEVLTILIRRICKPNPSNDPVFPKAVKALEELLSADDEGGIALDVVRIMSKTMKVRKYNVDEAVLNILLSLDVLADYSPNTRTEESTRVKIKKKDRVHLSKKQRKARKELKEIEEEMRRAEQAVSAEEREHNQAEILKLVLALYLNILKSEEPRLIASVLEGLSKFGHMANFDLLGDFLTVMKELVADANMDNLCTHEVRKVLLCIVTAFSLVSNHNQMKVSVDLSAFVDALYGLLPYLSFDAEIEFSHKTLRLADPLDNEFIKPSVNVSTKAELLLKALDHVFFRSKSGTKLRATAFTKRLYMVIEHTPEKTSIALLKFLDKLMSKYPAVGGLYSTEDVIANGNFHIEANTPARSNPEAATLWENALLVKHYSPTVAKGIRSLLHRSKESN